MVLGDVKGWCKGLEDVEEEGGRRRGGGARCQRCNIRYDKRSVKGLLTHTTHLRHRKDAV